MTDFNRGNRSGGRRSFAGRSGYGGGGRDSGFGAGRRFGAGGGERREMHKAICAKCGSECEVPFFPSGDRPVFCNNCFDRNRDSNSRDNSTNFQRQEFRPRPQSGVGESYYKQFDALNAKLDRVIDMLSSRPPQILPKEENSLDISDIEIGKPVVKKEKKKRAAKKTVETPIEEIPAETPQETS